MKKVRFLKDHVNGIKKGDVGDFNEARSNYLVRERIAEYVIEESLKKAISVGDKEPKKSIKVEPCKTC